MDRARERLASTLALFTAFLPPLLAGAGSIAILVALHRLGPKAIGGSRWPVYRLGNLAGSGDGVLELAGDALRFRMLDRPDQPDLVVPLAAVVAVRVDGECVRLEHRAAGVDERSVFLPTRGPDVRALRAHQSAAIAARIAGDSTIRPDGR